ncbi:MAG: hypothetical protein OXG04_18840 [Acidobacteria bacterium]|nr:hypothetical protein [Acidobacteriota bacterium]
MGRRRVTAAWAGLTILAYPEEAAEFRSRTARERHVSERIISMFEVATRVFGLDEETRDALFFGLGEKRSRHLVRALPVPHWPR